MSQFDIITSMEDSTPVIYNSYTRRYVLLDSIIDNKEVLYKCDINLDSTTDEISDLITFVRTPTTNGDQVITIFPTTNCNAKCWYCYEAEIARCDMSQNTIEQTIKFIKQTFNKPEISINWFGGEPLLNIEAINQITLALKDAGYILETCITSNGSFITLDLINLLLDNYRKTSMCITIDAIGDEYGKIKRYTNLRFDKAYQHVIANVKLLLAAGIKVLIRINFQDFEKAKQTYKHVDAEFSNFPKTLYHIYYAPIWDMKNMYSYDDTLQLLDYMRDGNDVNVLANPFIDNVFLHHIANEYEISYCSAMNKNHYVINADGTIYRCHNLVSDSKYSCGNVYDGINESALGYKMFEPKVEKKCESCPILPVCMVKCRVRNVIYGDDTICQNTKKIIDTIVRFKIEQKEKRRSR